ncbi:putative tricarboxylic transport membrane protein [Alkalihalobacillus xiaoxiensis]|uniref:Tricarboxylic transport membrane protein n=1 Tax=Shouchella xiaoxiensis TaxID=766895 RepID=A0ABS2SZJ7_9BACI|nr:tripartite tricarboxylate transporter TctB family protein [Shouchella xiaoxiensis]MBM7840943.1 putative tricarboxylic transport membrane protein [Shouchella xiaoxiensis]
MKMGTIIAALFTIILGLFVVWQSKDYPAQVASAPGPGIYPTVLGSILILLGILLIVQTIISKKREAISIAFSSKQAIFVYKIMGICILYCIALPYIGFIISSFMFVGITGYLLGQRNWLGLIITPLLVVVSIFFIFGSLFNIPLPNQTIL